MSRMLTTSSLAVLLAGGAAAGAFSQIRIGDFDGFGLGTGAGFVNTSGNPVNVDGVGILADGDFVPDWNANGSMATGQGDDFDYRSAAEIAGDFLTGSGFTDTGSTGSQFTDISLSTSYDDSASIGAVNVPPPGTTGSGGAFPKGDPDDLPNQPGFVFDFRVAQSDLLEDTPLFFNLVFADYDVTPATVEIRTVGGGTLNPTINVQSGALDGLIQAAALNLSFDDVFVADNSDWRGSLEVDFLAPREPWTAFDYVEISTRPITVIPEPLTMLAVAGACAAVGGYLRRRRRA